MSRSPAVDDAIQRETELGERLVDRYRSKLEAFEDEHGMSTETFRKRFEAGELGDNEAFFEWLAASRALEHWEEKLADLEAAE
jgi:hypothetical protein